MYTSSSLERVSGKVMRRVRTYSRRGICIGSKLVPLRYSDKDWSGITAGPGVTALVSVNPAMKGKTPRTTDSYLRGATLPSTVGDARTLSVRPTAKRDWLIVMGAVTPNGVTPVELEWVPGDLVYAEHDTETEENYDAATGEYYEIPYRRAIECADDCTEEESLVIHGGYFKAKA